MLSQYCIIRLVPLFNPIPTKVRLDTTDPTDDAIIKALLSQVTLKDYRYFWFELVEKETIRNDGVITIYSKILKTSPRFFINAYVETYEDVLVNNKNLGEQMTNLGWTHIVRSISSENGWSEHYRNGYDKVIKEDGSYENT